MASSLISPLLISQITPSGQNRFTATNTSLSCNKLLFDVSFTVPENYKGGWEFLKDIRINHSLRLGSGNGTAAALVSDCSLHALLSLSDYQAGVSMKSTTFTAGDIARISGRIDLGYFEMGSRDALETTVVCGSKPSMNVNLTISNVYQYAHDTLLYTYASANPTGADQPYKNVLGIYYDSATPPEADAVIKDQCTTQQVNIPSAIALANAEGRFEFFTDFAQLYSDPFGLSQDITMKVPVNNESGADVAQLLVVGLAFYPELLISNSSVYESSRSELVSKIRSQDSEKYDYLSALGIA